MNPILNAWRALRSRRTMKRRLRSIATIKPAWQAHVRGHAALEAKYTQRLNSRGDWE